MDFEKPHTTYEARYPGIFSEGFGIVPRIVLTDKNLSPTAKLLYSYLACCANREGVAFPSIQKIRDDLGLGRDVFRKSRRELETAGYISTIQKKESGSRFGHSVFLLNLEPLKRLNPEKDAIADDCGKLSDPEQNPRSKPATDFPAAVGQTPNPDCGKLSDPEQNPRSKPATDFPAPEKQPTKNTNWIDNPSNLKGNLNCKKDTPAASSDWTDGRTDFEEEKTQSTSDAPESPGFAELAAVCVNRNLLGDVRTRRAYDALLAEGFKHEDILRAWKHRQAEAKKAARATRFYPQLYKWLVATDTQGARAQITASSTSPKPNSPRRPQSWTELARWDKEFERAYYDFADAEAEANLLRKNDPETQEHIAQLRLKLEAESKRAFARWDEAHGIKEVSTHA